MGLLSIHCVPGSFFMGGVRPIKSCICGSSLCNELRCCDVAVGAPPLIADAPAASVIPKAAAAAAFCAWNAAWCAASAVPSVRVFRLVRTLGPVCRLFRLAKLLRLSASTDCIRCTRRKETWRGEGGEEGVCAGGMEAGREGVLVVLVFYAYSSTSMFGGEGGAWQPK